MNIAGVLPTGLVCLATAAYSQEITWPQELSGDDGARVLIYQLSATRPQLEHDYSARQQGARRTQNYQRQGAARRR